MSRPLEARTAVVTGGGQGIGRAGAERFAAAGATVIVAELNAETGADAARRINELGGRAHFVPTDVSDEESARQMVEETLAVTGRLDVLFNNAGVGRLRPLAELTDEFWHSTLAVNLRGVFLVSKFVLPVMMEQRRGSIINVASVLATVGERGAGAYCASKGGVAMLTRVMAVDYAPYNIRANAVCPGFINTPMAAEDYTSEERAEVVGRHPFARLGEPEEVAELALFLAGDAASFITGALVYVDGGYTAW